MGSCCRGAPRLEGGRGEGAIRLIGVNDRGGRGGRSWVEGCDWPFWLLFLGGLIRCLLLSQPQRCLHLQGRPVAPGLEALPEGPEGSAEVKGVAIVQKGVEGGLGGTLASRQALHRAHALSDGGGVGNRGDTGQPYPKLPPLTDAAGSAAVRLPGGAHCPLPCPCASGLGACRDQDSGITAAGRRGRAGGRSSHA